MQPTIVERGAFHVVGLRRRIAAGELEGMYELWGEFSKRDGEIADKDPCVCYGVVIGDSRPGDPGFLYMACAETKSPGRVPPGMAAFTVPAGRYAVFTHRGPIADFHLTVRKIWKEWLPASGLTPTGAPDVEVYDERFKLHAADSECDMLVPVK